MLTGGASTRMRRNKALLPWGPGALVESVAGAVEKAAGSVVLVGNPAAFEHLPFRCIPDERPGFGPLSGLHAALSATGADYNLIVACDMPDLDATSLHALLENAEATAALCTAAQDARLHPLCAVYRREALAMIEQAIKASRLRVLDLVYDLGVRAFPVSKPLRNCNTPDDWAALQHN